jgi:WD40 repeat protein
LCIALRRYALSTLVNTLLATETPIPLEFLINGSYLRTSIDEYLASNGISAESTLTVEYVRALIPPLFVASFEHDDWVSSVDVTLISGDSRILCGSYDGNFRVWNSSSQILATSPNESAAGHTQSVKSVKFVSPSQIASSGIDRTVRLWKYSEDPNTLSASINPQLELYGHKGTVESISIHHPSHRIISASADSSVGLWSTLKSEAPPAPASLLPTASAPSAKRRKLNPAISVPQRGPLTLLKQHSGPVSDCAFDTNDSTIGYSTSWDHSLRTWDLVTSASVDTRTTSHALLSMAQLPALGLIAAGSSARHVTLIDPRASATTVSAMTLRGHANAVVALARDPESDWGLVSGSHDGTCRVWDVRSTRKGKDGVVGDSVYMIQRESANGKGRIAGGEGVKVFGVCWDSRLGIVSASEDKRVQINRGEGLVKDRHVVK